MKNKKTICGTILLLFAISGICSVIDVSALFGDVDETITVPSSLGGHTGFSHGQLNVGDEITFDITTDYLVHLYIMTDIQYWTWDGDTLPSLFNDEYLLHIQGVNRFYDTYKIDSEDTYWVMVCNTNSFDIIIHIKITWRTPIRRFMDFMVFIIIIAVISFVIAPAIAVPLIVRKKKIKSKF